VCAAPCIILTCSLPTCKVVLVRDLYVSVTIQTAKTLTFFWSPHYHYLTDKIEGVQCFFTKRLARLANESHNVHLLLLNLESLEYQRLTQHLVLCYKIHHRLVVTELYNALPRPVCIINMSARSDYTKYRAASMLQSILFY
jgi:hypothetical protein